MKRATTTPKTKAAVREAYRHDCSAQTFGRVSTTSLVKRVKRAMVDYPADAKPTTAWERKAAKRGLPTDRECYLALCHDMHATLRAKIYRGVKSRSRRERLFKLYGV
jgi:hypothetical protein